MAEEFEESEVIFYGGEEGGATNLRSKSNKKTCLMSKKKKKGKMMGSSMPMNIPREEANLFRIEIWNNKFDDEEEEEDEDEEDENELVPPHLMVRRRLAGGKMAYSVSTGNGRTLKGRDLSHVRNSILRMTGFLET